MLKFLVFVFLSGCTNLFYHPDRIQYVQPENYKFTYREVTFHSKDKTELIGWFFPAKTKEVKGTIIHFHGNAQNMSAHFLGLSWVMDRGYNLFAWDYRGYGISDGEPSPDGIHADSMAALDQGRALWLENGKGKFVVYGQSLGGAIAMRALGDYSELNKVDLVVQDGTFMSYKDIGFNRLLHSPLLPISPLAYVLVTDKYSSEPVVKTIKNPVLVIVALKDSVVPPKFGKQIYKTLTTEKKWIWKIKNGDHMMTFHDPKSPYRDQFISLLETLP